MKINEVSSQNQIPNLAEEQFFSIQDQGMIFDILRNKMYSNPILAICREITCNARDAHREVGKSDVPIQVFLPNSGEPYYKVKDFGPGISPDRMSNIFIKYTASTKRSDNVQTGGFGLGAKTPFSYSDTFTITTNYNGKKYIYNCFIDETKVGKLVLLMEDDTTEVNGTEITIPVSSKDFKQFIDYTEFSTRHWEVKPIIKGSALNWQDCKPLLEGDGWKITNSTDWSRTVKLIIDGIEYPLDLVSFRSYSETKIMDICRGNLLLYFGVGELSLSANREQIYLDKPTQNKIAEKFRLIYPQIKDIVEGKMKECSNYREAVTFCKKYLFSAFTDINSFRPIKWQGIDIKTEFFDIGCTVHTFRKGSYRRYNSDPNKISRSTGRAISFDENTDLYLNDLNVRDLVVKHVKKAFENDPSLKSLQVITPTKDMTLEMLNSNFHLDKMDVKPISDITKYSSRNSRSSSNRLIIYVYDSYIKDFKLTSYSYLENDKNHKIFCTFKREGTEKIVVVNEENKVFFHPKSFYKILEKNPNCSIYAVDEGTDKSRINTEFSGFEKVEDFIKNKVLTKSRKQYIDIKYLLDGDSYCVNNDFVQNGSDMADKIINKNSVFLTKLKLHTASSIKSSDDIAEMRLYEDIFGVISSSEIEQHYSVSLEDVLSSIQSAYEQTYPLLKYVPYRKYSHHPESIIEYINFMDSKQNNSK